MFTVFGDYEHIYCALSLMICSLFSIYWFEQKNMGLIMFCDFLLPFTIFWDYENVYVITYYFFEILGWSIMEEQQPLDLDRESDVEQQNTQSVSCKNNPDNIHKKQKKISIFRTS